MSSKVKTCENCGRKNLQESSFCDLCGFPLEVWSECNYYCLCPEPVSVEPDYPEAVFPDPCDYPDAVFATIIG